MITVDCSKAWNKYLVKWFGTFFSCKVVPPPPPPEPTGPELVYEGPFFRCSIATDSNNQPHIVATGDNSCPTFTVADRIGGKWQSETWPANIFDGAYQYGNPHVEIANDSAWYSGQMVEAGIGVICRQHISGTPVSVANCPKLAVHPSPAPWETGNLSLDVDWTDQAIVFGMGGFWQILKNDSGTLKILGNGQLYIGQGGEKNSWIVSRAPAVAHVQSGSHRMWMGAMNGYRRAAPATDFDNSSFNSLVRQEAHQEKQEWASVDDYPEMSQDECYCSVCADSANPHIAYTASDFDGIKVNISNGTTLLFPPADLRDIGGNAAVRYAPQMAPAKNGGAWILFNRNGAVVLHKIRQDGTVEAERNIGGGQIGSLCTDTNGDSHVLYAGDGKLWYQKIKQQ